MTTSLRWGLCILAALSLQIGCCSIHVDYKGPHCGYKHVCLAPECPEDVCVEEAACQINGVSHLKNSLATLHSRAKYHLTCGAGAGCGEVYWDEHINEPPVGDPCGCNNEWTGGYGYYRPWYWRLRDLWGYRYAPSACSSDAECGACGDCGHQSYGGQCSHCGHGIFLGRGKAIEEGVVSHIVDEESDLIISPSHSHHTPVTIPDPEAVPTPAKPKSMPSVLPGESESAPSPKIEKESASGKTAKSTKGEGRVLAVQAASSAQKAPAKIASGRRKLTTQTR